MFEEVLQHPGFWTDCGPYSHVVLSTRFRLARNMESILFPGKLGDEDLCQITNAITKFSGESIYKDNNNIIELSDIDSNEKRLLRERNIITHEMEMSDNSIVVVNNVDNFTILVNEEDHFRIQVIRSGLQLVDAYKVADCVDTELNKFAKYAFSDQLGYLTACTSNLGTGLRLSVLLHLPAVSMKKMIQDLIPETRKSGVDIKGTAWNSKKTPGSLYQLSNRVSLGLSEIDIIEIIDDVVGRIIEIEDVEREKLLSDSRLEVEDKIWRSFGVLMHSRRLSYIEAMEHLSNVRLGIILAVIKNLDVRSINDLMVTVQWAHLQKYFQKNFKSTIEGDKYRSIVIRNFLRRVEVV